MPHKVATSEAAGIRGWRGLGLGRLHHNSAVDKLAAGTLPDMNGNAAMVGGAHYKA